MFRIGTKRKTFHAKYPPKGIEMWPDILLDSAGWLCAGVVCSNFCLLVMALSVCFATLRRKRAAGAENISVHRKSTSPFVSIHVPSHDEPAEILHHTLMSLAKLSYPNFEVLVMDNNTPNESTWRPIETLCQSLGPRFRFFHVEQLEGAKAGALNLCLSKAHPDSEFIAIVDADYQVDPQFLKRAMDTLDENGAAFVQFPQAFRNVEGGSAAIALELEDYFSFLARHCAEACSPLLTGTLSVISIDAIREAGGWSAASVTEDAELGVRLFDIGRRGIFIDEVAGRGLLPMSLRGLKIQRRRWISGNIQTLIRAVGMDGVNERQGALSVTAQLLAWPAFWLIPAIVLIAASPFSIVSRPISLAISVSALTIWGSTIAAVVKGAITRNRQVSLWSGITGPLVVKSALVWTSSSAWLLPLIGARIPFKKTPKSAASQRDIGANAVFGIITAFAGILYFSHDNIVPGIACALASLSWPAAIWVDRSLQRYGRSFASKRVASADILAKPCTA